MLEKNEDFGDLQTDWQMLSTDRQTQPAGVSEVIDVLMHVGDTWMLCR